MGVDILELAKTFAPQRLVAAAVDGDDPSSMVYTGGTTGKPKGVVNHVPLRRDAAAVSRWPNGSSRRDAIPRVTPLSHAAWRSSCRR
ncbi:AMP-binding protein [Rhodococcus hoagii]|nr:AMP-binding protein [Prescottella equi]